MRIKNLSGVSDVRFKKTRLLHLGNVEKPPHPQLSAQRRCEGEPRDPYFTIVVIILINSSGVENFTQMYLNNDALKM